NKVAVLFGGYELNSATLLNDTWTWNGAQWKQVSDMGPAARASAALTHDATKGRSLLFGGADWTTLYADTWAWDGTLWRQLSDMGPPPRAGVGLCYDRARDHVVLFGGWSSTQPLADTWEILRPHLVVEPLGICRTAPNCRYALESALLRARPARAGWVVVS